MKNTMQRYDFFLKTQTLGYKKCKKYTIFTLANFFYGSLVNNSFSPLCLLDKNNHSTYSTSPLRYSPSGWYILTGWSAG